jgi:hypothetical protein
MMTSPTTNRPDFERELPPIAATPNPAVPTSGSSRHSSIGRMTKVVLAAAAGLVMVFTTAGIANADQLNPLFTKSWTIADCTINVSAVKDQHHGAAWQAIGGATMQCSSRHYFELQIVQYLNGQPVTQHSWTYWQNASGLGYDAYGQPKVFETPGWCGSGTWQTVLSVYFWQNGQWQYYPSLYDYKGSTSTGC